MQPLAIEAEKFQLRLSKLCKSGSSSALKSCQNRIALNLRIFSWHSQLWKEKRQAGLRRLQLMINYRISTLISAGSISNRRPFCVASQRAGNLLLSICDKFRLAPTNSDRMAGVTYLPACSFNIIHRFTRNLRARRLKIDGINSLN